MADVNGNPESNAVLYSICHDSISSCPTSHNLISPANSGPSAKLLQSSTIINLLTSYTSGSAKTLNPTIFYNTSITSIYIFGSPLRLEYFPPASNTANLPRLMRRRLSWPFLALSHTDISDTHCQPFSVWICSHVRQVNPKPGEVAQLGRSRRYKWKASKLQRSVRRWRSSPERLPC
ncbi:hypothetical protein CI102_8692 [Trichoderma harzianum]|uniref:Uncharacterized protein n=1 Tax=Trichoderma harzianum CBS 226.95 TaxID=983964 RepID=A0A2T4A861_TRIHA|nr:hypothetical protein M431DRAFT_459006 [Trichoderma harzianum CBS 226.95]PKK45223.1 hypothetical protein CI102_8692 [Trichoderma harzianum]PTB53183.1 hypothetical protein M431DRAFT_459006 [Trichoderma harzianum CBS 226.95]